MKMRGWGLKTSVVFCTPVSRCYTYFMEIVAGTQLQPDPDLELADKPQADQWGGAWARPAGRPGQPQSGQPGICGVRGWLFPDRSAWGPRVHLCVSLKTGTADTGLKDPMGFAVSPRS